MTGRRLIIGIDPAGRDDETGIVIMERNEWSRELVMIDAITRGPRTRVYDLKTAPPPLVLSPRNYHPAWGQRPAKAKPGKPKRTRPFKGSKAAKRASRRSRR